MIISTKKGSHKMQRGDYFCPKCEGKGEIETGSYTDVYRGVKISMPVFDSCMQCGGAGFINIRRQNEY